MKQIDDWLWKDGGVHDILKDAQNKGLNNNNNLYVTFAQKQMFEREVLVILGGDILFSAYSLLAVFIISILHLRSIFLATLALLQILVSYMVCFFVYRVVLGIELFGGLNFISFYLLLGIGCDDIFIYTDALRQSSSLLIITKKSVEKRLEYSSLCCWLRHNNNNGWYYSCAYHFFE